jgi:hypothetical protein
LNFTINNHEVTLSLISRNEDKIWVGILIDLDIRTIESVVCFTHGKIHHYYAYGVQSLVFGPGIYHIVIRHIQSEHLLDQL